MRRGRPKQSRHEESTRGPRERATSDIERLREENERLRRLLEEYAKRIADLERQLALKQQNSTLTSKPPSSDGLAGQQRPRGRGMKSRRTPGGQPGHPGHHRPLVPVEPVDAVVDLVADACRHCARRLHPRHALGAPRRHQVTEVPAITPHITEYRCHRRRCPDSTQAAWAETSAAVAAAYGELEAAVPHEPILNADETGHRTNGDKRWLWTFVARTFVLYRLATSRGSDVLTTVLGASFAGILGSDRLPAYLKYVVGQRQFCWAHVTRNVLSALDVATTPSATRFCCEVLALDRRLFRLWHRFRGVPNARGSPLTRAALIAKVHPIERRLFALGQRHLHAANADVRNLAHAFFVHHQHFFTFVYEDGVEPTNNAAERALRTAVQWRTIMFGTRSEQGERAVERLPTIVRSCQLQQLNALAYLTAAVDAHRRGHPVASLLRRQTP